MIRKMISLSLFAAVISFAANGFVSADCGTCANGGCGVGAGCASGNCGGSCAGGNCLSNLLGGLHHQPAGGPCMTCNNIWDDYCATKERCLPQAKYPFQHKGCGGCGACSSCNSGVGVGLYGKCGVGGSCGAAPCAAAPCAAAPSGPAGCDAPCAAGKCASGGGLLGKLFQHKHKAPGCAEPGCADSGCASSGVVSSAPVYQPAPVQTPSAPVTHSYSQPAPSSVSPASEVSVPAPSPSDIPAAMPAKSAAPSPPPAPSVAPSVTDQTNRTGAFDWLQQALQK